MPDMAGPGAPPSDLPVVVLRGLSKTYRVSRKRPGLAGAVRGLFRREYEDRAAVRGLSFTIAEGEFVGFIGPNGAGKTTTLKMLSGLLYPTSGEALVLGHVPWRRSRGFLEQISFVMGQKSQLWWELPAMDTFLLVKEMYGLDTAVFRSRLDELAAGLGVEDLLDVQVRRLSLGERMKCELIAALLHGPRLMFLDEPTIGLDVVSQRAVRDFLREQNSRHGTTIILTSHQLADIEQLCRRVIVINHGRILHDGDISGLKARLGDERILRVTLKLSSTADEVQACRHWLDALAADATGNGSAERRAAWDGATISLRLAGPVARRVAAEALSHPAVEDVELREPPLEEAVEALYS